MALTRQRRQPTPPELNMASMIDVVFLLLIFFMCTSSFETLENDMPSQMPQAGTGEVEETDFEPVRINLTRISNSTVIKCGDDICATFKALLAKLKSLRSIDDIPVIIEGEETVPFGHMVATLDMCYQADLRKVAFSAKGVAQ